MCKHFALKIAQLLHLPVHVGRSLLTFRSTGLAYGKPVSWAVRPAEENVALFGFMFIATVFTFAGVSSPGVWPFAGLRLRALQLLWPRALAWRASAALLAQAQYPAVNSMPFMHCARRTGFAPPF